ncbi:hypothetical protein FH972_009701 [Carpinus fangiana]|uniref:Uncharacterized protein n=1 Tax=Carpinus fangiana TaxID=176857 RepID=A0A660KNS4_9ROSI|nr:hypothetical protein FH972_009701 [Carpinus fangiana]
MSISINAAALHQHTSAGITKPPHRHCSRAALSRNPSTGSGTVNLLAAPACHGQPVHQPSSLPSSPAFVLSQNSHHRRLHTNPPPSVHWIFSQIQVPSLAMAPDSSSHLTAMVRCCCQMPSIKTGSTQPPPVFIDPLPPARSVHRPPPLSISILTVYDSELPRTCRSAASVGGALLHALPPAIVLATDGPHHQLLCRPFSLSIHVHAGHLQIPAASTRSRPFRLQPAIPPVLAPHRIATMRSYSVSFCTQPQQIMSFSQAQRPIVELPTPDPNPKNIYILWRRKGGPSVGLAGSQRRGVGERDGGWWASPESQICRRGVGHRRWLGASPDSSWCHGWASPVRSVAAVVEGGGGRRCWPCWVEGEA